MVVHFQSNGGTVRNEQDGELCDVTLQTVTSLKRIVIKTMSMLTSTTKMFQCSLNLTNRTFKIDAKILDLLRRFKAGLVKVSASIRAVVGPFNEPSKLCVYLT